MEINFTGNGLGAIGMGREAVGATGVAATAGRVVKDTVTFTRSDASKVGLVSAEPIVDVPDSELVRDDALGRLVGSAFNMPPPPMPTFTN